MEAVKEAKAAVKEALSDASSFLKETGLLEKTIKLRCACQPRSRSVRLLSRGGRRDLIKAVRKCRTAAEERALIAKESAAMRAEFRDQVRVRVRAHGAAAGEPKVPTTETLNVHACALPGRLAATARRGEANVHAHDGLPDALWANGVPEADQQQLLSGEGAHGVTACQRFL